VIHTAVTCRCYLCADDSKQTMMWRRLSTIAQDLTQEQTLSTNRLNTHLQRGTTTGNKQRPTQCSGVSQSVSK